MRTSVEALLSSRGYEIRAKLWLLSQGAVCCPVMSFADTVKQFESCLGPLSRETLVAIRNENWDFHDGRVTYFLASPRGIGQKGPTSLSASQEAARTVIIRQLEDNDLEPRALGRSDYPTELPLSEVLLIARHCSSGIILGFEQFRSSKWVEKTRNFCRRAGQHINSISNTLEPLGVGHSFWALFTCCGVPRRRHQRRYIRCWRFRCFHSPYATAAHQGCY
jgi:hypothetical protein